MKCPKERKIRQEVVLTTRLTVFRETTVTVLYCDGDRGAEEARAALGWTPLSEVIPHQFLGGCRDPGQELWPISGRDVFHCRRGKTYP